MSNLINDVNNLSNDELLNASNADIACFVATKSYPFNMLVCNKSLIELIQDSMERYDLSKEDIDQCFVFSQSSGIARKIPLLDILQYLED